VSYFLFFATEDGIRMQHFSDKIKVVEFLEEEFLHEIMEFVTELPRNFDEFCFGNMILIKGEIGKPTPINLIKKLFF